MSKPIASPKCEFPGCSSPRGVGRMACAKHVEPCDPPWGEVFRVFDDATPIKRGGK